MFCITALLTLRSLNNCGKVKYSESVPHNSKGSRSKWLPLSFFKIVPSMDVSSIIASPGIIFLDAFIAHLNGLFIFSLGIADSKRRSIVNQCCKMSTKAVILRNYIGTTSRDNDHQMNDDWMEIWNGNNRGVNHFHWFWFHKQLLFHRLFIKQFSSISHTHSNTHSKTLEG